MPEHPILSQLRNILPTVSVGVLAAELLSLGAEIKLLEAGGAELLHIDVMDGCFVPKMTVGPPFIKAIQTRLLKDVHLLIDHPLEKVADYVAAGADMITLHVESDNHIHRALQVLAEISHVVRGIGLNPSTSVESVVPLLDEVDMVFLVAVNPGWGGQKFIPATYRRFDKLKRIIEDSGRDILTGLDGGINRDNITDISQLGADIIVSGSAIFDGKAPGENLRFMLEVVKGV